MTTTDPVERTCTLVWSLDATPAQVFRAWTDPAHLRWFYNDTKPEPSEPIEVDLRVGGAWRQRMVISGSTDYVTGGVYLEIVPDERLVFAWGAVGGWPELDTADLERSPQVTVMLSSTGGRTEMVVVVELPEGLSEDAARAWWDLGIRGGWRATVDRLEGVFTVAPATG